MEVLGIIPARGGSKGIPKKNLVSLAGKPMLYYSIKAAQQSKILNRCILSSDDPSIITTAKLYNLEVPFIRPSEIAQDGTPSLPVFIHAVQYLIDKEDYKPDVVLILQPTSPLRTAKHIDEALLKLKNTDADSIVSVTDVPHNFNPYSIMRKTNGYLENFLECDELKNQRQLKPKFLARNGAAIYAVRTDVLLKNKTIYGEKILPYLMEKEDSFDVDDIFDLEICEYLIEKRNKKNKNND